MTDPDRRDASLDLTGEDLGALLAGVTALAEQEIAAARSGPVFERAPSAVEVDRLVGADRALPVEGESVEELLAACAGVLAGGRRTTPTFFGYVQSPPAPVAVVADLLASAADQNLTSWRSGPAAAAVEHQTLRWLGEFVGFDDAATGILVSGGSAANLTALLVALRAMTGPDDDRRTMRVYASAETHFSVAKAATALGVGCAGDRRRRPPARPGGAADGDRRRPCRRPVADLRRGQRRHDVHRCRRPAGRGGHRRGRCGRLAARGRRVRRARGGRPRLPRGSSRACTAPTRCASTPTSGCTPRSTAARCWCTTRRPPRGPSAPVPTTTFASSPPSRPRLSPSGITGWSSAAVSGRSSCGRRCASTAPAGSRPPSARTSASPPPGRARRGRGRLRAPAGPGLSICCFRHAPRDVDEPALDAHNERILQTLQRDGRVYLSNATVDGRFALRACITNFRTTPADVERVLTVVRELAG